MKRILAVLLALALCCGAIPAALADDAEAPAQTENQTEEAVPAPDALNTLTWDNLEKRVRENNATVKMLQETIESINATDYDKMKEDLRKQLNQIASGQRLLLQFGQGDSYAYAAAEQAYSSLRETFDDLKDGNIQQDAADTVRQLQNAQNQVIAGAESLYVALLEMQNSRASLQRQLAAMDRTVAEMDLRYKMGQISALQLHQVTNGRTALVSGIATLDAKLDDYTAQMELMAGARQTGSLTLAEPPAVTDQQAAAMNYDKDLAAAKEQSYELYDAKNTLDDAKDDYWSNVGKYAPGFYKRESLEHTWQAAQYTYQNTVQNFEIKFRTAYNAVADYRQALTAKESALSLQEETFQSMKLKYNQGTISKNAYLDAQDALESAKTDVATAKHNLFTAYRTYYWALHYGVLN